MKTTGKNYPDVIDMVRETADEFEKHLGARRLVGSLVALRAAAGLTETALAAKMGCGRRKILRMESSTDGELRIGDMTRYAEALGYSLKIDIVNDAKEEGALVVRIIP